MPPPPQTMGGHGGPSTFDKRTRLSKLANNSENGRYDGFIPTRNQLTPGTAVGVCVGAVFGGYTVLRYGGGQAGILRTWGKYIASSAATFGFFMSIGTVIRTEGRHEQRFVAWHRDQRSPIIVADRGMDKWRDEYRQATRAEKP